MIEFMRRALSLADVVTPEPLHTFRRDASISRAAGSHRQGDRLECASFQMVIARFTARNGEIRPMSLGFLTPHE
jgi:hypothetical protein